VPEELGGAPLDFDDVIFTIEEPADEIESAPADILENAPVTELDGPDGLHLTSMGNAERFLRDYRNDILWVEGPTRNSAGTFYCWDGQRWQPDNARAVLMAKDTVSNLRQLIALANEAGQKSDVIKHS
jgi:hypothetical protein